MRFWPAPGSKVARAFALPFPLASALPLMRLINFLKGAAIRPSKEGLGLFFGFVLAGLPAAAVALRLGLGMPELNIKSSLRVLAAEARQGLSPCR